MSKMLPKKIIVRKLLFSIARICSLENSQSGIWCFKTLPVRNMLYKEIPIRNIRTVVRTTGQEYAVQKLPKRNVLSGEAAVINMLSGGLSVRNMLSGL